MRHHKAILSSFVCGATHVLSFQHHTSSPRWQASRSHKGCISYAHISEEHTFAFKRSYRTSPIFMNGGQTENDNSAVEKQANVAGRVMSTMAGVAVGLASFGGIQHDHVNPAYAFDQDVRVQSSMLLSSLDTDDLATETVDATLQLLKDASGDKDKTLSAYEEVAAIITEGKGVGGQQSYKGVTLARGLVEDEDTTIYNPGLSLLTESEKMNLVQGVIQARKSGLANNQWSNDNQMGYEFLREKLDPFHVTELRGYLKVLPFLGGLVYVGTLAVQQVARQFFPVAYIVGALVVFAPIALIVAAGP